MAAETRTTRKQQRRVTPGRLWNFPSDHLPIGVKLSDTIKVASWNCLNNAFFRYIMKNEQNLVGSTLTMENISAGAQYPFGFTKREVSCVGIIEKLLFESNHSIVCLQEVSILLYKQLRSWSHRNEVEIIASSSSENSTDRDLILFNTTSLSKTSQTTISYESKPANSIIDTVFIENTTGYQFRVIETHVPFGRGLSELVGYLNNSSSSSSSSSSPKQQIPTVCLGDMNATSQQLGEEINKIKEIKQPLKVLPPDYNTHVNARSFSCDYDCSIVSKDNNTFKSESPSELLPNFQPLINCISLL